MMKYFGIIEKIDLLIGIGKRIIEFHNICKVPLLGLKIDSIMINNNQIAFSNFNLEIINQKQMINY